MMGINQVNGVRGILVLSTIKNISAILMIFLPNILVGCGIGVLVVGIINQVYLYNHLKLLQMQVEVKANQRQVSVLTRNLSVLVAHQPTAEHLGRLLGAKDSLEINEQKLLNEGRSSDEVLDFRRQAYEQRQKDIATQLLSQKQVDQMLNELQLSQVMNSKPAAQLLNKLKKLQFETALFFKAQLVDESGLVSFETPLADEPDKARLIGEVTTIQAIRQLRVISQKEKVFTVGQQKKFLDFITFYETVATALVKVNQKHNAKLEDLLRAYQETISNLLSIQAVEDYQYDTYQYWLDQLQKLETKELEGV